MLFGPLGQGEVSLEAAADVVVRPESPGGFFGRALVAADLDGDGMDSLVIGSPMDGAYASIPRAGLIYVLAEPLQRGEFDVAEIANVVMRGATRGDDAGSSVASCDVDGNGVDELLVGAPTHAFDRNTLFAGRVYWTGELDL